MVVTETLSKSEQEFCNPSVFHYSRSALICPTSGLTFELSYFPLSWENILTQQKINSDSVRFIRIEHPFHYTIYLNTKRLSYTNPSSMNTDVRLRFCVQLNIFSCNIWYINNIGIKHTRAHMETPCHFVCWHISATATVSLALFKENNSRGCQISGGSSFMTIAFSSGGALYSSGNILQQIHWELWHWQWFLGIANSIGFTTHTEPFKVLDLMSWMQLTWLQRC